MYKVMLYRSGCYRASAVYRSTYSTPETARGMALLLNDGETDGRWVVVKALRS